jgi:hypothetical protein
MALFDEEGQMSEPAKKKRVKDGGKAADKKKSPQRKDQKDDYEQIERAVYDGMQDLREEKSK